MPEAVIVATARSPIGRAFKGSLTSIRPDDLLAQIVTAALAKVPELDPSQVEDLIVGCGLPGGEQGFNIARVTAVLLGLDDVPGTTVNRYCSSSLQSTRMAYHAIKAGEGDVFITAGVECVSRFVKGSSDSLPDTKNPLFGESQVRTEATAAAETTWHDPREDDQVPDVYIAMGQTAENLASLRGITRAEQDEFGVRSQNLAEKALANGFWQREITPVTLPDGSVAAADDGPRAGTTLDKVATLKPVFREHGTVTAGNCCPLNDGAAALVVMSDAKAAALGLTPLARIVATGVSALSPEIMGLGPVKASQQALRRAGMAIGDVDLVEINEAFAAQVIPSYRDLGIDPARLNVNGGAIAVGHPFGMTGARIATTLINSLQFHDKTIGLETMCVGGGQGMAMIFERLS
jgi:acetyl-CoA C-acetyltransferase